MPSGKNPSLIDNFPCELSLHLKWMFRLYTYISSGFSHVFPYFPMNFSLKPPFPMNFPNEISISNGFSNVFSHIFLWVSQLALRFAGRFRHIGAWLLRPKLSTCCCSRSTSWASSIIQPWNRCFYVVLMWEGGNIWLNIWLNMYIIYIYIYGNRW